MRVRQHIPSFFEGCEPRRTYVFNTEDLEGLEFIRHWSEEQMFHRFAVHRHYFHRHGHGENEDVHLMLAEFDGGKQWWVIAYLEGDDSLEILAKYPEWEVKS